MSKYTLPSSTTLEAAILGAIIACPECLPRCSGLTVAHFYHPRHQAAFMAIRNLEATLSPIDPVTIEGELRRIGKLEAVGGLEFIASLVAGQWGLGALDTYVDDLTEMANSRAAITRAAEVLDALIAGADEEHRGAAAVAWASRQMASVDVMTDDSGMTIGDVVKGRMRELGDLERRIANGETALTGLPTGIVKLDEKLGGYQPEIVTVIGGRPRMGKSSLLLAALNACSAAGIGVHEFSMEDSRSSHADRALGLVASVPVADMRALKLRRDGFERLNRGTSTLIARKNWQYDDRPRLTVAQVVEAWRRHGDRNGTKLAAIDYVQLMRSSLDPRARQSEKLDQIMTDLAAAAKTDKIAVILAAQVGRAAVSRAGSRPTLEDFKEAGAIEERCKAAIMVHRGCVYGPPVEGVDWDPSWGAPMNYRPDDAEWAERCELIVVKNSNGAEGEVFASFDGPTMRVS